MPNMLGSVPDLTPLGFEPRQQRGIDARDRLFAAALELYGERGVAATRVEDIVGHAGVAWGTFFRYFPRKEDVLLRAACIGLADDLAPLVDDGMAQSLAPHDLAMRFFERLLGADDYPIAIKGAIIRETVASHDRYLTMLAGRPSTFELIEGIVGYGRQRGALRDDEHPAVQAGVLACATIYPVLYGFYDVVREQPAPDPDTLTNLIHRAFAIAWRGLART